EAVVKIPETGAGNKPRQSHGDDGVVAEQRPVLNSGAQINADKMVNVVLEGKNFERAKLVKPQKVTVIDDAELRGDFKVDSQISQPQARIHEIALPFNLAGTQIGHQAFPVGQVDARSEERRVGKEGMAR